MIDNNSDEREFELGDSPFGEFDYNIEELRKNPEAEEYRGDWEKRYNDKIALEPESLYRPDVGQFEVSKGDAADVAYLAWDSEGSVTAADIQLESMRPDSRTGMLTRDDAREGLRALAQAGLVSMDANEFTGDDLGLYTEGMQERITDSGEVKLNPSPLGRIRYRTGEEEQLRAPLNSGDEVISDPARAFQEVGQMQQNYEFKKDWYTDILGDYPPEKY